MISFSFKMDDPAARGLTQMLKHNVSKNFQKKKIALLNQNLSLNVILNGST